MSYASATPDDGTQPGRGHWNTVSNGAPPPAIVWFRTSVADSSHLLASPRTPTVSTGQGVG
eukprot:scaffold64694_cov42-Phaeocystis_antarctica.AAC.1